MKYMNEEVIPYQIPETAQEFEAYEADGKTILALMEKWGFESVTTDGCNTSFTMRRRTVLKDG